MGKVHEFQNCNQRCVRRELDQYGPVRVTVRHRMERVGKKDCPMVMERWTGRHLLVLGDEQIEVSQSITVDGGPKLGTSLNFVRWVECSEEERAANRESIRRAVEDIFHCECHWKNEGGGLNVGEVSEKPPTAV